MKYPERQRAVCRRKGSEIMEKIRHEPRDVTALKQTMSQAAPVQLAQIAALMNIAAAMLEGYANIAAANEQKQS